MTLNSVAIDGAAIDGTQTVLGVASSEWVLYFWANEWVSSYGESTEDLYPVPSFKGPSMPLLLSMVQAESPGGTPAVQGEWKITSWPNEWSATAL